MPNYRLDLGYNGARFHGWARQPGVRTVQGELEAALGRICRIPVETVGAGRTDTGVHARGQVASFVVEEAQEPARLIRGLNSILRPDVAVTACQEVSFGFDARFSASWRAYRYQVLNRPVHDPLLAATVWHVESALDVAAMDAAVACLVGEHDFASFCRAVEGRPTLRRVTDANWQAEEAGMVVLRITADSFCQQMVRSVTGMSVEVGRGRIDPETVPRLLAARDRSAVSQVAPPQGLILWEVGYDET